MLIGHKHPVAINSNIGTYKATVGQNWSATRLPVKDKKAFDDGQMLIRACSIGLMLAATVQLLEIIHAKSIFLQRIKRDSRRKISAHSSADVYKFHIRGIKIANPVLP